MPTLSTILLSIKGEARKANIQLNSNNELTMETIQKYFKKKDEPERVCYYEHDNKIIFIFGYKKGKKGTENKTELPDPHASTVLYGDAIVVVSMTHKWETPIPFTVEQWNAFYNNNFGEEEDEEEDDEEDDEEDEEEVVSEADDKSVKDDFDNESDEELVVDDDDEAEEVVQPVKRRRAPAYNKVDVNSLKEEISVNSEAESYKLRMMCLNNMKFLEPQFSKNDIRSLEQAIYEAAYNYAQKNYVARSWKSVVFIEIYRQIVRSVFSNIHPESPVKNPRLLSRVLDGEFKLFEIPSMTSYDMFPEKWFELKDKLLQREQKILEGNKSRATDQFKCRRCHKRECTYYELQTRSADEPMTCFISCLNCGKEWRQGG
jgi:DNA-directed RNA polymerase subunit M/transcription elongation factor TFIIS